MLTLTTAGFSSRASATHIDAGVAGVACAGGAARRSRRGAYSPSPRASPRPTRTPPPRRGDAHLEERPRGSERLDSEVVHGLMTRAFEVMLPEVHRCEGTVNQFLGDGIMASFGAPIVHEDLPRSAVQAARLAPVLASAARALGLVVVLRSDFDLSGRDREPEV